MIENRELPGAVETSMAPSQNVAEEKDFSEISGSLHGWRVRKMLDCGLPNLEI